MKNRTAKVYSPAVDFSITSSFTFLWRKNLENVINVIKEFISASTAITVLYRK